MILTVLEFLSIIIFGFWGLAFLSTWIEKKMNNPRPVKKSEYEKKEIKRTIDDLKRNIRKDIENREIRTQYRIGHPCEPCIISAVCGYLDNQGFTYRINGNNELYIELIKGE